MNTTESIFNRIMNSSLFRLDGEDVDLTAELTNLGNAVMSEGETDWSIGEYLECDLVSLIIGAYWALTEWHGGQDSDTYAAMCSLGQVYSPGMTDGPEPDSSKQDAYNVVCSYYETNK